jgi:DNA polymerase III subunit gamma/tau
VYGPRDAAGTLAACDQALQQGIEAGHLTEQLLAYWRDMLVAAVRGTANLAIHVDPEGWEQLASRGEQLGPETILAGAQILDHALVRMRQSTHARILLELAIIRICQLDQLDDLG